MFINFYLFILREGDREREREREGQGEGERESPAGFELPAQSPMWGLNSRMVRSSPEPRSRVGRLTD